MAGYIKNLKKSFLYVLKDLQNDYVPQASGLIEGLKKNLSSEVRSQYSGSNGGVLRAAQNMIKRSPYYSDLKTLGDNVYKGIATGKLYTEYGEMGMDFDFKFDESSFESNYDMFTDNGDEEGESAIEGEHKHTFSNDAKFGAKATMDASRGNATIISETLLKQHIDNRVFMSGLKTDVIAKLTENSQYTKSLLEFNNDVMRSYVEESVKYYNDNMSVLNDIKKSLQAGDPVAMGDSRRNRDTWVDKINAGNIPDAMKLMMMKSMTSMDSTGMVGMAGSMMGQGLSMLAMNPWMILPSIIGAGANRKFGLNGIKKVFNDAKYSTGTKLNTIMGHMSLSDNNLARGVGGALVTNSKDDKRFDMYGYRAGVSKWSNQSDKTLNIVIPGYLAKILAALDGKPEQYYNIKTNQWRDENKILSDFRSSMPSMNVMSSEGSRLLRRNVDSENFKVTDSEEQFQNMTNLMIQSLSARGLNLEHIADLKFEDTTGKLDFKKLFNLNENPELESAVTETFFVGIKNAMANALKTEGDVFSNLNNDMYRYNTRYSDAMRNADMDKEETGMIHIGDKIIKASSMDDIIRKTGRAAVKSYKVNDTDMTYSNGMMGTNLTPDEFANVYDAYNRGLGMKDIAHIKGAELFKNNEFFSRYKDTAIGERFSKNDAFDISAIIQDTVSNPIVDNTFVKSVKSKFQNMKNAIFGDVDSTSDNNLNKIIDGITNNMTNSISVIKGDATLTPEQKEEATENIIRSRSQTVYTALSRIADVTSKDLEVQLKKIDADTTLSASQKADLKTQASKMALGNATIDAAKGLLDNLNKTGTDGTDGKESKLKRGGKMIANLMGGVLGAKAIGGVLRNVPLVGSVFSMAGPLAPILLTSAGLAAGIYAHKEDLIGKLIGKFKNEDDRKRIFDKTMKNILPSAGFGIGTGVAVGALTSFLPFGGVLAPIMGASAGLAAGIYAHKEDLFKKLFGKKDKNSGDGSGKDKLMNGIVTAIGIGTTGTIFKAMGGGAGISGLLGGVGGALTNPILLATAAIGASIFLEKDNIKKKLFGDGAEDKSFLTNAKDFLFGKEEGKEGIITKQMRKITGYLGKSSEKIHTWFKESIVDNIKDGFRPFTETISGFGKGLLAKVMGGWDNLSDKVADGMDKGFFGGLGAAFEEKVINPLGDKLKWLFGGMAKIIGSILSAPFKMFGALGRKKKDDNDEVETDPKKSYEDGAKEVREAGTITPQRRKAPEKKRSRRRTHYGRGGKENFYSQHDSGWASEQVGGSTVSEAGCAIATMAMALSFLKDDSDITPASLLKYASKHKVSGDGIHPNFFSEVSDKFGVLSKRYNADDVDVKSLRTVLRKGGRIIALVSEDYNGSNRHYVYVKGSKGNLVTISDPNKGSSLGSSITMSIHELNSYAIEYITLFKDDNKKTVDISAKPKKQSVMSIIRNRFNETVSEVKEANVNRDLNNKILDQIGRGGDYGAMSGTMEPGRMTVLSGGLSDKTMNRFSSIHRRLMKIQIRTLKSIDKNLKEGLNGVSYNMEYIKRILVKNMEDIDEKPGKELGKFNKFKVKKRKNKVMSFIDGILGYGGGKIVDGVNYIGDLASLITRKAVDTVYPFVKGAVDAVKFVWDLPGAIIEKTKGFFKNMSDSWTAFKKMTGEIATEIKEGIKTAITDIWSAGKRLVEDTYELVKGGAFGLLKGSAHLGAGLIDMIINGFKESKLLKTVSSAFGGLLGKVGNLFGLGKAFDWIKGKFGMRTDKMSGMFGPKKVFVTGGTIDIVKKVEGVGVVGAVDADIYRETKKASNATESAIKKEKVISDGKVNSDVLLLGYDKPAPTDTPLMREEDAYQDATKRSNLKGKVTQYFESRDSNGADRADRNSSFMKSVSKFLLGAGTLLAGFMATSGLGVAGGKALKLAGNLPFIKNTAIGKGMQTVGGGLAGASSGVQSSIINQIGAATGQDAMSDDRLENHSMRGGYFGANFLLRKAGGFKGMLGKYAKKMINGNISKNTTKFLTHMSTGKNFGKLMSRVGMSEITEATIKTSLKPSMIYNSLKSVTSHGGVQSALKKVGLSLSDDALKELSEVAVKNGMKKSGVIMARTGANFIPFVNVAVTAGFVAYDLISGSLQAHSIFGVDKRDVTFKMRAIAAIVKAIQGLIASSGWLFVVGLIPVDWLIKWAFKHFASDEEMADYESAKAEHIMKETKELERQAKDDATLDSTEYKANKVDLGISASRIPNKKEKKAKSKEFKRTLDTILGKSDMSKKDSKKMKKFLKGSTASKTSSVKTVFGHKGIDRRMLRENTNMIEKIMANPALSDEHMRQAKYNYKIGPYTYDEVGCGPTALAQVYKSFGLDPDIHDMAKIADYYSSYINKGGGIPWKYMIDYPVFDGLSVKMLENVNALPKALQSGGRAVLLLNNSGSKHYVSITGMTANGDYILHDPLMGRERIVSPNDPLMARVHSGMIVSTKADADSFSLSRNADSVINNPNFNLSDVGRFSDVKTIFNAKAWANVTGNDKGAKVTNYTALDDMTEDIGRINSMTLNTATIKRNLIKDMYNDNPSINSKYGIVRYKDDNGTEVEKAVFYKNTGTSMYGGEIPIYDEKTGTWKSVKSLGSPKNLLSSGHEMASIEGSFGSKLRRMDKISPDIQLLDMGGTGPMLPTYNLNDLQLQGARSLEHKLLQLKGIDRKSTNQSNTVIDVNTMGMEKEQSDTNTKLDALIILMSQLVDKIDNISNTSTSISASTMNNNTRGGNDTISAEAKMYIDAVRSIAKDGGI